MDKKRLDMIRALHTVCLTTIEERIENASQAILRTLRPCAANHDLLQHLTYNNGTPPFTSLKHVITTTSEDMHFDRWNLLHQNGLPLRRRDGLCDMMYRVSNYTIGSQCEPTPRNLANLSEVTGPVVAPEIDIRVKMGKAPPGRYDEQSEWNYEQRQLEKGAEAYFSLPSLNDNGYSVPFGLEVIAWFKTQRQKWLVDGDVELVIGETDFGHLVGKVEMRTSVKSLKEAARLGKEFDREITAFVDRCGWIFKSDEPVVGKRCAHIQTKNQEVIEFDVN